MIVRAVAALFFLVLSSPSPTPADPALRIPSPDTTAILVGRILSGADRRPLQFANVLVLGTRRGAMVGEDGRFRITALPAGTHTMRVQLPGFPPLSRPLELRSGKNDLGDIVVAGPPAPDPVAIGSRARVRPEDLVATIRPVRAAFIAGEAPAFEVRIRNRGGEPVLLVQSVDASDSWASPRVTIEISGPEGGFAQKPIARCGNNNGVNQDDFVEVPAGGEFDPFAGGWLPMNVRYGTFADDGTYTATFHYKTTETNPGPWASGPCMGGCDLSATYRNLLAQVPAVELSATTTFRVLPGPRK